MLTRGAPTMPALGSTMVQTHPSTQAHPSGLYFYQGHGSHGSRKPGKVGELHLSTFWAGKSLGPIDGTAIFSQTLWYEWTWSWKSGKSLGKVLKFVLPDCMGTMGRVYGQLPTLEWAVGRKADLLALRTGQQCHVPAGPQCDDSTAYSESDKSESHARTRSTHHVVLSSFPLDLPLSSLPTHWVLSWKHRKSG